MGKFVVIFRPGFVETFLLALVVVVVVAAQSVDGVNRVRNGKNKFDRRMLTKRFIDSRYNQKRFVERDRESEDGFDGFAGIQFCDEQNFDSIYQDSKYLYLTVYDENNREMRHYRYRNGAKVIDQYTTLVDSASKIPQTGFYVEEFDLFVETYYTNDMKSEVTFCAYYGDEHRLFYNRTNPWPVFPLCGCGELNQNRQILCNDTRYWDGSAVNSNPIFPDTGDRTAPINNKLTAMYFDNDNQQLYQITRKKNQMIQLKPLSWYFQIMDEVMAPRLFYIQYDLVGMFEVVPDDQLIDDKAPPKGHKGGNHTHDDDYEDDDHDHDHGHDHDKKPPSAPNKLYVMEEVRIPSLAFVDNYIWQVKILPNGNISFLERHEWREFFGCTSSTKLPLKLAILILAFTAIGSLVIILSLSYFFFDYNLLMAQAKATTMSYYL